MIYNFDKKIDRLNSDSIKWIAYGEDVLPLWVADMDFISPRPVIEALLKRVEHGVFGYGLPPKQLTETICDRLHTLYGWKVFPNEIIYLPGVVVGFNNVTHAMTQPGRSVVMMTPVYGPFLTSPGYVTANRQDVVLEKDETGHYYIDYEKFESTIDENTQMFLLCNPHNPLGRVFTKEELSRLAEICLKHKIPICSDEIHCDLIFKGHHHIPIASLNPEIAKQTITLMAPSKTFNIAGLGCSFAIVQNPEFRERLEKAQSGLVSHVNILGSQAALAAYQNGGDWLDQLLDYLTINRDYLLNFVKDNFPLAQISPIEGTYLAWIDFRKTTISENPFLFFLKNARVALNDGSTFGPGGDGFVRLNFGCTKSTLMTALDRMKSAFDNGSDLIKGKNIDR
ncbi:MAG: MalY/PatB family protein [Anaerolineaceae bacterium]